MSFDLSKFTPIQRTLAWGLGAGEYDPRRLRVGRYTTSLTPGLVEKYKGDDPAYLHVQFLYSPEYKALRLVKADGPGRADVMSFRVPTGKIKQAIVNTPKAFELLRIARGAYTLEDEENGIFVFKGQEENPEELTALGKKYWVETDVVEVGDVVAWTAKFAHGAELFTGLVTAINEPSAKLGVTARVRPVSKNYFDSYKSNKDTARVKISNLIIREKRNGG